MSKIKVHGIGRIRAASGEIRRKTNEEGKVVV
jgi:hypothetical protein